MIPIVFVIIVIACLLFLLCCWSIYYTNKIKLVIMAQKDDYTLVQ